MHNERRFTLMQIAAALLAVGCVLSGCSTPKKVRDIELKGMYANAATETVAIGTAKITMLPESLESFVAHYSEDTAWLRPSEKTHALDIYMTGTNCTSSASKVVDAICKAFVDVAPQVAATHAANAGGTTAFDVVKGGGEVRKTVALAKSAVESGGVESGGVDSPTPNSPTAADCANGECPDGNCTDGEVK